ncbi:MAG: hypothetical protein IJP31_05975 [Lachnospiraceae bacterium]|nr:hypothetical protein [Lachnospiraceae bacterium]
MYLGYLASGGNSLSAGSIASGLDHLMFEIRGGKSLSQVIAENTNGQYTGLSDFETRFAQDGIAFTQQLLGAAGNGYGAVVGGLTSENLLGDNAVTQPVFALNPDYEEVWNEYKDGYDIIEGGRADVAGTAGAGHPNYNANAGTGGTGGNAGTGGTGGNTGTGGIGGNTGTGGTGGNTGTGGGTGGTTPGTGSTPGTGGTNPGGGQSGGIPTPAGGGISLQVGAEPGQKITVYIEAMDAAAIGVDQVNISTAQGANQAIDFIKEAITKVSSQRSHLGACQNRLEHTINNLENVIENTTAAESQIRDVDMARLMVEYSNNRILLQAGQAMLSQSNSSREFLLALFS